MCGVDLGGCRRFCGDAVHGPVKVNLWVNLRSYVPKFVDVLWPDEAEFVDNCGRVRLILWHSLRQIVVEFVRVCGKLWLNLWESLWPFEMPGLAGGSLRLCRAGPCGDGGDLILPRETNCITAGGIILLDFQEFPVNYVCYWKQESDIISVACAAESNYPHASLDASIWDKARDTFALFRVTVTFHPAW